MAEIAGTPGPPGRIGHLVHQSNLDHYSVLYAGTMLLANITGFEPVKAAKVFSKELCRNLPNMFA